MNIKPVRDSLTTVCTRETHGNYYQLALNSERHYVVLALYAMPPSFESEYSHCWVNLITTPDPDIAYMHMKELT